jgi:ADP-ribose pyrophosphatase YjhB (NUDIX family)
MTKEETNMAEKYPRVGTAVIVINNEGKVLLAKRNSKSGNGKLSVPGGKLDMEEDINDCMKRELREETGLDLFVLTIPLVTRNLTDMGNHYVCFWGLSFFRGDEPSLEHVEYDKNGQPKTQDKWTFYDIKGALENRDNLFGSVPQALMWYLAHGSDLRSKGFSCFA